jgi:hypothetical protein
MTRAVAIVGGLLLLVNIGPGGISMDEKKKVGRTSFGRMAWEADTVFRSTKPNARDGVEWSGVAWRRAARRGEARGEERRVRVRASASASAITSAATDRRKAKERSKLRLKRMHGVKPV